MITITLEKKYYIADCPHSNEENRLKCGFYYNTEEDFYFRDLDCECKYTKEQIALLFLTYDMRISHTYDVVQVFLIYPHLFVT